MPRRSSYTATFKLTVVDYAEKHGKWPAARHFGIDESNMRLWCRKKDELKKMPRSKKASRFRPAQFPELEERLLEYVANLRSQGLAVSILQVRINLRLRFSPKNRGLQTSRLHKIGVTGSWSVIIFQ